jgi:hypothetical protein
LFEAFEQSNDALHVIVIGHITCFEQLFQPDVRFKFVVRLVKQITKHLKRTHEVDLSMERYVVYEVGFSHLGNSFLGAILFQNILRLREID